jgi:hypothetical protein
MTKKLAIHADSRLVGDRLAGGGRIARLVIPALLLVVCALLMEVSAAPPERVLFRKPEFLATADFPATSIFSSDLGSDGDTDLLVGYLNEASGVGPWFAWLENDGHHGRPRFTFRDVALGLVSPIETIHAADVDGDGDMDIVAGDFGVFGGQTQWYENDGESPPAFTWHPFPPPPGFGGVVSVHAADLDGDGDTDVLEAFPDADRIAWYENDGARPPTFALNVITVDPDGGLGPLEGFANEVRSVYAADLDGDGDTDVLSASRRDDKIAWYENQGGTPPSFLPRIISISADMAFDAIAADVNGDGAMDVLSASGGDRKIAWYENDGSAPPFFLERIITEDPDPSTVPPSGFAPRKLRTADVDGDADLDILSASGADSEIVWFENKGGSPVRFTPRVIPTDPDWRSWEVFPVDLNGDGRVDLAAPQWGIRGYKGRVAWFRNIVTLPDPPVRKP